MAIVHHPNLAETSPTKPVKFQLYPQKLPNGISLWASLLSIFIYTCIFYIFNLSPSSLLSTTNFWFFISNTLILIIAADFGAYASSRKQAELYEDYMIRTRANSVPTFESQYREIVKTSTPPEKVETPQEIQERIKEVVVVQENPNKLQIATKNDLPMLSNEKFRETSSEFARKANDITKAREEKRNPVKCVRSLSDIAIPVTNSEENNKMILRRAESEKKRADGEERDEFSALSDEEVNRRVEEFIQRFNRQIRLQAAQNRIRQI